jgi:hypothetical protein
MFTYILPTKANKRIIESIFQKFFLMFKEGIFIVIAFSFSYINILTEIYLNPFFLKILGRVSFPGSFASAQKQR